MLPRLAFLLHAAVETPAAASFLFAPARQLSPALLSPASAASAASVELLLVLHNLGGLLAATVLLSLALAVWGVPPHIDGPLRGALALALAGYHYFPCRRAYLRRKHGIGMQGPQSRTLGGPAVHLAAHIACCVLLVSAGMSDLFFFGQESGER
ncbi:hypothetical protein SPI_00225 [Niveomyces insectorum RCEF 264]|uniref:Uncharacterized protein n=1 Tax=Niveomyces insectorum RCEF 264 TaxID=1081102 RepID=A0A167ZY57_9HYPO|nr:hypothetical protein SPI_00225 [Niveomyces insectorum RCEF 264]